MTVVLGTTVLTITLPAWILLFTYAMEPFSQETELLIKARITAYIVAERNFNGGS